MNRGVKLIQTFAMEPSKESPSILQKESYEAPDMNQALF